MKADISLEDSTASVILPFLKQYGYNSFSTLLLYHNICYYYLKTCEGLVGYFDGNKITVVIGDPICSVNNYSRALNEFIEYCVTHNKQVIFLLVGETLTHLLKQRGATVIRIGDDFIFDIGTYAPRGDRAKMIRLARNHALRAGLIVHEYKPTIKRNEELEAQFLQVAKRWSEHRSLNSHFLGLNLFDYYELKRYFYGTVHEELIAFMSCAPIFARNGYLFEDVVRDPNAPYGAIELMTLEALAQFKEEGKLIATFGISPRLDPIDMDKLPFKGRAIIKSAVWCANTFMNLQGLHHFRKKFSTERAESMYLVKYPEGFSIRDLVAILRSFNIV